MQDLTAALFKGLLGERFEVASGPDGPDDTFVLAEVEPLGRSGTGREAFSLIFHGSPSKTLANETFLVSNPGIGSQPIFLGPIARDAEKTSYQAIFA